MQVSLPPCPSFKGTCCLIYLNVRKLHGYRAKPNKPGYFSYGFCCHYYLKSGLLNLITIKILDQIIHYVRGCLFHYRMFSSICGLYSIDARWAPSIVTSKTHTAYCWMARREGENEEKKKKSTQVENLPYIHDSLAFWGENGFIISRVYIMNMLVESNQGM